METKSNETQSRSTGGSQNPGEVVHFGSLMLLRHIKHYERGEAAPRGAAWVLAGAAAARSAGAVSANALRHSSQHELNRWMNVACG